MEKLKYYLLAIIACLGWGSAFAFIKLTLQYAPTFQLSGMRFMLSGLILLPFLLFQKPDWRILIKEWKFVLLFSFFQIFIQYSLYFAGIDLVPASIAAIVVGLSPLIVFIMAHYAFHNDRFTPRKIFSIILGLSGVIILTLNKGDFDTTNPYYIWGIIMVFLSVTVNCSVNIIVAKNARPISAMLLTGASNFIGGVMLYIFALFVENTTPFSEFDAVFWWLLLVLAIISSLGFSIWFYLLKVPVLRVSEVNIWKFIIPVFGAILSWLIFPDDKPNLISIIGIISITLAILILQWPSKHKEGIVVEKK